jgi:hypothetical protein
MRTPDDGAATEAAMWSLLGCSRAAGPRALLGLGDGAIDRDTLEAALISRRRAIEARSGDPEITARAMAELEAAAAALRPATVDAAGRSSSLPPVRPIRPPDHVPPPPGPIASRPASPVRSGAAAGSLQPQRPRTRVTAAQLTAFDRLVLSILVSGGGWNARTRVLIAGLAHQAGIDAAMLRRVVMGLAGFMRQQGVAGTFGEMARAQQRPAPPLTPGRLESALLRMTDGVGREFRGESRSSFFRLVTLFGLLAIFFGVVLVTVLTAPSPVVRDTNLRRQEAEAILTRQLEKKAGGVDATHVVVPSTRPGVARPMVFDRPPMFRGGGTPDKVVLDLARVPTAIDELIALSRQLELDVDRLPEVQVMRWNETVDLFSRTWPRLTPDERTRAISGVMDVLRFADDPVVADRLVGAFSCEPEAPIRDPLDVWRRAFRSGLLGEAVVDAELPEPVRATARTLVSTTLPGVDGRHTAGGPFAELGGRSLDATAAALVGQVGAPELSLLQDAWERWFEAQEEIRRPEAVQRALVSVLGTVLDTSRGLGRSGPSTDLLGRLVGEIDWTSSGPDPEGLRDAFEGWMRGSTIDAEALWVLGSILDGPAGIGWFRPEFVVDPQADLAGRIRTWNAVQAAWPESRVAGARGELLPVDPVVLREIDRLRPEVLARVLDARSPRDRLEALLGAERLALATTMLAADRVREAEAAIGLVIAQIDSGDLGVEIPDTLVPVRRSNDGEFAQSLKEAGGDIDTQMALLESLLADALAGDLGPRDAEALVQLAWRGKPAMVRETARVVVLDMYAGGVTVAMEMLDTSDRASPTEETAEFIERFTGVELPPRGHSGWEEAVRRALLEHAIEVLDPNAEGVDRIVHAIAEVVASRGAIRSGDPGGSPEGDPAVAAMRTTDVTRRIAEGLFLAPGGDRSLNDLDRRRVALRRLALDASRLLVAEHISELEYLAFILEAQVPVRQDALRQVVEEAAEARSEASSGLEQAARTMLRMVDLERLRMVPREDDPLGGVL